MPTKPGYSKTFHGTTLSFPKINSKLCAPLLKGKGKEIKYTHFSVFVHKDRKLPLMTAVNIKGEAYAAAKREEGAEPWDWCDQVDKQYQVNNDFYGKDLNTFDRGHLVRRVDPCWGDEATATQAELDTFRWVNCTPQHRKLNRENGAWYQLEQHVMEKGVKNKNADISVFAGPVLAKDDLVFKVKYKNKDLQIPLVYWKVIVWKKSNGSLNAVGFMMSQYEFIKDKLVHPAAEMKIMKAKPKLDDDYFENLKFTGDKTYQVPISAIEKATGISFNCSNVSFPYKKKSYTAIKATPLKKVYAFQPAVPANMKMMKAMKPQPLTEKQVKVAVKKGYAPLLKRYNLSNITL